VRRRLKRTKIALVFGRNSLWIGKLFTETGGLGGECGLSSPRAVLMPKATAVMSRETLG
jgi:hypothetical protein